MSTAKKAPSEVKKAPTETKKAAIKDAPEPDAIEREIRAAAQRIFEDRQAKGLDGDEVSDWVRAEAEVKKKHKLP